jgi:hypothetical protein
MAWGEETPDAKLQKLHLARQKGTDTYTPNAASRSDSANVVFDPPIPMSSLFHAAARKEESDAGTANLLK